MKRSLTLALLVASPTFISHASELSITTHSPDYNLSFDQPVRLVDALNVAQSNKVVITYPLAAYIATLTPSAEFIAEVEDNLNIVSSEAQATAFAHYLKQQTFNEKLIHNLDIDVIRLDERQNPLLRGDLALFTPNKSQPIVVGAVTNQEHQLKTGTSLESQWNDIDFLDAAQKHQPIIIQPDGTVFKTDIGYWVSQEHYLAAGSIVYVPFFSPDSTFDNAAIELLKAVEVSQ